MQPSLLTWFSWLEIFWSFQVLTVFFYFFLKSADRSSSERFSRNELLKQRHRLDHFWPKMGFVGVAAFWLLMVIVFYIVGLSHDADKIAGIDVDSAIEVALKGASPLGERSGEGGAPRACASPWI